MKKVLTIIGVLFVVLIVVPLIAGAIGGVALDVVSMLYLAAIIALPFVLVGLLVRRQRKRKARTAEVAAPTAPEQAPQQVAAPPQQTTQQAAAPSPAQLPYTCDGFERRYHYQDVNVYVPNPEALNVQALNVGARVALVQEPENQYDNKAVAVVLDDAVIGYLNKGRLQDMANDWMKAGKPVLSSVRATAPGSLQISIAFYDLPKLERLMQRNPNPTAYKLTRTASKATQEALDFCSEGDELDLEEDDDGRLFATNSLGDSVGYLPAKAAELVEDYGGAECCSVFLAATDMDTNLKTTASVYIFRGK